MAKVLRVVVGPVWPEAGSLARVVELDDGSGQVQTYSQRKKRWKDGGIGLYSATMGEGVDREMLLQLGYDEDDIAKILPRPEESEESRNIAEAGLMKKIVEITIGASFPESGGIARVVEFEDGSGQIQTYSPRRKAWVKGGSSIQSLLTSEDLDRERLEEMGYGEEDIRNILWQPGD